MKKIRSFFITFLSVLLLFSTFSYSTLKVHAQDDVTKVNRFYSADTVVTGTTTPNTIVKYVKKNEYGYSYRVFSAVSNSDGIFKLYVGYNPANTTFTINTYDSNGNIIESDEVFVITASLHASFDIGFYNKNMPYILYSASEGSKIEIIVNDKIIKTIVADMENAVECSGISLGDFVKIRVSKGNLIKTYEQLATGDNINGNAYFDTYHASTSKFTTWSDSIIFYFPANLKYSGLFDGQGILSTGTTGVIKKSFENISPKNNSISFTLYDKEFENVISNQTISAKSPKPEIDPVSQISKEVTGSVTASSLITVLDEQNNKLGESVADGNGRFAVPVNNLEPDTVIKVETRMPNTDKYDYSLTSVEEVYIDELSDNNGYITGQSSFGTEADVFLIDPISINLMKSLSLNGATTPSTKKLIGNFRLNKGSMFKLNIGKQKANSNIQVVLKENDKSLTLPSKIVKDKTAPVISNIKNNGFYKVGLIPVFNEGTATIDGKKYVKGTIITIEGKHKLIVKDNAGYITTVVFTIDKKAPVISKIKNNGLYKVDVIPVFNEGTATIDGKKYVKGTKITKNGYHKLIVKDNAGNMTTVVFTIDKKAPLQPTVNKIKTSSRSISGKGEKGATIYVYKGKARVGYTNVNSKGTYSLKIKKQRKGVILTVYAKDKAGNKSKPKNIKVG